MRLLRTLAAVVFAAPVLVGTASAQPVTIQDFGTVRLEIDYKAQDPHVATDSIWLRRSDDGAGKPVLEQFTDRFGRWKDSLETQDFFPARDSHSQFETDATPFAGQFFFELNKELGDGSLRDAKLAAAPDAKVQFKLAFDPKGHVKGLAKAQIQGALALADGHLRFSPSDEAGAKVKPLVDLLLAELEKTNKERDEAAKSVVLFGLVGQGGASLSETTWSCSLDGPRGKTEASSYAVSADSEPSLRAILAKLDGKFAIVRAVLDDATKTAKVLGVFTKIGWDDPIYNAPDAKRSFAKGGTLANLTDDEARTIVSNVTKGGALAEVMGADAATGFAKVRAPDRKGALEPGTGYVKLGALSVFEAAKDAKDYSFVSLDSLVSPPSRTVGMNAKLGGE